MTRAVLAAVLTLLPVASASAVDRTCGEPPGHWLYGPAAKVTLAGATAYIASGASLQLVDVADPAAPVLLGQVALPVEPEAIAVAGPWVYVADGTAGLRVVDASDPHAPAEVAALFLPGESLGVAASGDHLLVANDVYTRVVDVSAGPGPHAIGVCDDAVFADRFESGDTSRWSVVAPWAAPGE